MNNFWNNISRYPRFFLSSIIGLILIILNPLKNLLKIPRLRIFLFIFIMTFSIILILIIKNIVGL